MRTGHVAVAVSREEARENGARINLASRKYGGDAGTNRPLSTD